jgi:rRNA large subunit m3Psi methyltransferase RlmH
MKILIAIPIKKSPDPLIVACLNYIEKSRIKANIEVMFLSHKFNTLEDTIRLKLEGSLLLEKTNDFYRIALSLERHLANTKRLAFLIGGASGLSNDVINASDASLSLSNMTLPHRMALLMLGEQLFRAGEIMHKTPYHKA